MGPGRRSAAAGLMLTLVLVTAACERGTQPEPTASPAVRTVESGKLTVGSDIPFAPFEFEKDGKLTGFDVDLMEEIGRRLGLSVRWVDTEFETIFTQVASGRFDAVASGTTITEERKAQVPFTDPYFIANQALTINIQRTPGIRSTDDLKAGDTVGVQQGTTGEKWARENLGPRGVEARSFPAAPDPYVALEAGAVTAVLFDEASAVAEAGQRAGLKLVQTIDTGERLGFPVNPGNRELLDAINEALREIIADGTYRKIYDAYPDLGTGGDISKAPN